MARIFNIYFQYDDMDFSAVVSVRTTPFFKEYTLMNLNETLVAFLPGNKIISRDNEHYSFQNSGPDSSTPLMNAITRAISEHMHATKV